MLAHGKLSALGFASMDGGGSEMYPQSSQTLRMPANFTRRERLEHVACSRFVCSSLSLRFLNGIASPHSFGGRLLNTHQRCEEADAVTKSEPGVSLYNPENRCLGFESVQWSNLVAWLIDSSVSLVEGMVSFASVQRGESRKPPILREGSWEQWLHQTICDLRRGLNNPTQDKGLMCRTPRPPG